MQIFNKTNKSIFGVVEGEVYIANLIIDQMYQEKDSKWSSALIEKLRASGNDKGAIIDNVNINGIINIKGDTISENAGSFIAELGP